MAATDDPRRRQLLQVLLDHLQAEATGDFDRLVSTLSDDPQYHFWIPDDVRNDLLMIARYLATDDPAIAISDG